jgi:predicted Fe-Mo cluster-binding NifX family protein
MPRIAVVTDDHQTVSAHFGRASFYDVFSIEDGKVISREIRSKSGHNQGASEPQEEPGQPHGRGPVAEDHHARMVGVIRDCQVMIGRGMGRGAYDFLSRNGIRPILTDIQGIDEAVQAYLMGNLVDHPERLH